MPNLTDTYPGGPGAEQVSRLHYTECSGTDQDPRQARARVRDNRRGCAGADGAVCEDGRGPGGLTYRAGAAGTGRRGRWLEKVHLGS